jgi:hypothetical protein
MKGSHIPTLLSLLNLKGLTGKHTGYIQLKQNKLNSLQLKLLLESSLTKYISTLILLTVVVYINSSTENAIEEQSESASSSSSLKTLLP